MIITSCGNNCPHQCAILMHAPNHRPTEQQKLHIRMGSIAWIEQIALSSIANRPVDVFSRTINSRKRLLVQEADKAMFPRYTLENGHCQLLVIASHIGGFKNWRNLKLTRSHFVVASFSRNA